MILQVRTLQRCECKQRWISNFWAISIIKTTDKKNNKNPSGAGLQMTWSPISQKENTNHTLVFQANTSTEVWCLLGISFWGPVIPAKTGCPFGSLEKQQEILKRFQGGREPVIPSQAPHPGVNLQQGWHLANKPRNASKRWFLQVHPMRATKKKKLPTFYDTSCLIEILGSW